MYFNGEFICKWCILKASGDSYEVSNGKSVYKVSASAMSKGKFEEGELMMHLPQPKAPVKKKVVKKKATKKK